MKFTIDLKILVFFAIFYFTNQLELYLWTMLFCLIHEMGHLIIGITLGLTPEKIEMTPFGFYLQFEPLIGKSNKQVLKSNILIAVAGPITNLIIIFIILFLHISFTGRDIVVYMNLIIFTLNLIPIYPLDGGRILKGILEIFYDEMKAEYFVNKISNFYMIILTMIGSIAIYYFKNIAILFIICYLWSLVIKENKKLMLKRKMIESLKNKN